MPHASTSRRSACALLLTIITACGGDSTQKPAAGATDSSAPAPVTATATASAAPLGETVFQRCVICHQPTGEGIPNIYPPLAGSAYVTGPADRPIAILLHGLQGPITVKGAAFNGVMMPYGNGIKMSDEELAAVVTYIRGAWGNGASAVSAADVARERAATASRTTQLTAAELEAIP